MRCEGKPRTPNPKLQYRSQRRKYRLHCLTDAVALDFRSCIAYPAIPDIISETDSSLMNQMGIGNIAFNLMPFCNIYSPPA